MTPRNPNLAAAVICQQDCKPQMIILLEYVKRSEVDLYSYIYKESIYLCNCKSTTSFIFQESGCTFFLKKKKKKKKETRGLPWVKISKVMPQPNSPFPPGKGGKLHGKKSKSFG